MKKFIDTVPSGGAPILAQELVSDVLTKETWTAIEGILGSLKASRYGYDNDNILLSGGLTTANASNWDITAGVAYFPEAGGIIAEFPAVTNVAGPDFYVELLSATIEQKTFFDAVDKDYTETYTAQIVTTEPAGDFIHGETADTRFIVGESVFPTLQRLLDYAQTHPMGDVIMRTIPLPTWNMNFSAAGAQFKNIAGVYTPANIVALRVMIVNDSGLQVQPFEFPDATTNAPSGNIYYNSGTALFVVQQKNDSVFDSASYSSTGASRGWITIWYIE